MLINSVAATESERDIRDHQCHMTSLSKNVTLDQLAGDYFSLCKMIVK